MTGRRRNLKEDHMNVSSFIFRDDSFGSGKVVVRCARRGPNAEYSLQILDGGVSSFDRNVVWPRWRIYPLS